MLGAGIYMFEKAYLAEYRNAVNDLKRGKKIAEIINDVEGKQAKLANISIYPGERYKRVPRGYDPDHENASLLLNKGLTAFCEGSIPKELYSEALIDYAYDHFKKMAPIHQICNEIVYEVQAKREN